MKSVRIAGGLGFYGDSWRPIKASIERGNVQYVASDHLAELTLAIFQKIVNATLILATRATSHQCCSIYYRSLFREVLNLSSMLVGLIPWLLARCC